jgi:hypothetical protein
LTLVIVQIGFINKQPATIRNRYTTNLVEESFKFGAACCRPALIGNGACLLVRGGIVGTGQPGC